MALPLLGLLAGGARVAASVARIAGNVALKGSKAVARDAKKAGKQFEKEEAEKEFFERTQQLHRDARIHNMQEIDRFSTKIQVELIQKIQKQLGAQDIDFTQNLRQNIKPGMDGEFKTVEADTPYAYFVEFGLPAGKWVNFNAIHDWVEGKLGITDEPELTNVTWAVLRKINAKGIEPTRFMKKGIKALIAKRGVIITRSRRGNKKTPLSKLGKIQKKIGKMVKKMVRNIRKNIRKTNRMITKAVRKTNEPLRRINKYQRKIGKFR